MRKTRISSKRRSTFRALRQLEQLEKRSLLAVSVFSSPGADVQVEGSDAADVIVLRLDPSDSNRLQIYSGSALISTETRTGTRRVFIYGGQGNDLIQVDEQNGSFAETETGSWELSLRGGGGNDILIDGAGRSVLEGNEGDDQLFGNDGNDVFYGGRGTDTYSGGGGFDTIIAQFDVPTTIADFTVVDGSITYTGDTGDLTETFVGVEHVNINATDGPNVLHATTFSGTVSFFGKAGDDTMFVGDLGSFHMSGDTGHDVVTVSLGNDNDEVELNNISLNVNDDSDHHFHFYLDIDELTIDGGDGYDIVTIYQPNPNTTVHLLNVEPIIQIVDSGTPLFEGQTFARQGTLIDYTGSAWTMLVDYGDGSGWQESSISGSSFQLAHSYTDDGLYDVHVKLSSDSGIEVERLLSATIGNVAPTLDLFGDDSVYEGSAYELHLGQPVDPGDELVSQYVIAWGDGATTVVEAIDLPADRLFAHVYADGTMTRKILVTLIDEDGAHEAAGSKRVLVQNVAPQLALEGAANTAEGDAYELTLGAVIDPGDDQVTRYVVHWGDGDVTDVGADELNAERTLSHTYANGTAQHVIRVDLQDEDSILPGPTLDQGFGNGGLTYAGFTTSPGYGFGIGIGIASDPVSGASTVLASTASGLWLVRYTADDQLDTTFGDQGRAIITLTLDFAISNGAIATDSLGRIYLAGAMNNNSRYSMAVARYDSHGQLDTSFGTAGIAEANVFDGDSDTEVANGIVIDPQGRILLMGYFADGAGVDGGVFARLTDDGQLDPCFGQEGAIVGLNVVPFSGALTPDNQLLVLGQSGGLVFQRYSLDGAEDPDFLRTLVELPADGNLGFLSAIAVDAAGNILVPGTFLPGDGHSDLALVQYDPQGTLVNVSTFAAGDPDGYALGITVAATGEVLLTGAAYNSELGTIHIALARLSADAHELTSSVVTPFPAFTADSGYGIAPVPNSGGASIVMGDINGTRALVRLLPNGSVDPSFGDGGYALFNSESIAVDRMVVDDSGNIWIVTFGTGFATLARFTPDGAPDLDFGIGGVGQVDLPVEFAEATDLVIDGSGRLVVAAFVIADDLVQVALLRLHVDGSLDDTFGTGGLTLAYFEGSVPRGVALSPDGGFVVEVDGPSGVGIARFSDEGVLDTSFGVGGVALLERPDDMELWGGITSDLAGNLYAIAISFGTTLAAGVARFDATGALDRSFGSDGVFYLPRGPLVWDQALSDVHIGADNRLLITGTLTNLANASIDVLVARVLIEAVETVYASAGELSVTVDNVAPTPFEDATTIAENEATSIDVLLQAFDPADTIELVAGSAVIASAIDNSTGESIALASASVTTNGGLVIFDPGMDFAYLDDGQTATLIVNYTITDGEETAVGLWTITVNGEGQTQVITLSASDVRFTETEVQASISSSDPSSVPAYEVTNVSRSGGGAVNVASGYFIDAAGVFHWTPGAGQLGVYVFEVVANGQPESAVQFTVTTLGVVDGALTIVATGGADKIVVKPTAHDATKLSVRIQEKDFEFQLRPHNNSDNPYGGAERIRIYAMGGADEVTIHNSVTISAEIHGGAGTDQLRGGDGHDVIFGDSGNDAVWGGAGDDFLIGGSGNDVLQGQKGNDVLLAGDLSAAFNTSFANLRAISAAWSLLNPLIDLLDGNGDGDIVTDAVVDQLDGGQGSDWFLASSNDTSDYNSKKNKDGDKLTIIN
jgi:uncharacterized delta-60 repeat protein